VRGEELSIEYKIKSSGNFSRNCNTYTKRGTRLNEHKRKHQETPIPRIYPDMDKSN
jgi:hypothetical protein